SSHRRQICQNMELLNSQNWMLWKHQMLAIFWDLNLIKYIEDDEPKPIVEGFLLAEETKKANDWKIRD
ncbi:hypothetical protein AX17_006932, partial [Amanita inopinata Kibby_2008]